MDPWGDPDSPQMGRWVDGWLGELRQRGASARQLEECARRLGTAYGDTSAVSSDPIVAAFWAWVWTRVGSGDPGHQGAAATRRAEPRAFGGD